MKYKYLYQSSENKNLEGWINARNRAEAYAALRKRGIRPYRLVGDDPPAWRRIAAFAALSLAFAALFALPLYFAASGAAGDAVAAAKRQQLPEGSEAVARGLETAWEGVFASPLDRYLAAYAQPGWIAIPPDLPEEEKAKFADELSEPQEFPEGEPAETRLLRRIVAGMRSELAGFLADGGSVDEYLAFLEERQDEERAARSRAAAAVAAAAPDDRRRLRAAANARLRAMGLAELPAEGE